MVIVRTNKFQQPRARPVAVDRVDGGIRELFRSGYEYQMAARPPCKILELRREDNCHLGARQLDCGWPVGRKTFRDIEHFFEGNAAESNEEQNDSEYKSQITDTVHDESFVCRFIVRCVLEPETNEEIGAQPDALPPYEHQ